MDRLTVSLPGRDVEVVLRRWADEDGTTDLVVREAAALTALAASPGHGVPVPELVATGPRRTLTTALAGEPDLAPADPASWLAQLAAAQAAVHTVTPLPANPRAAADRYEDRPRALDWIADRGLREAARQAADGPPPRDDLAFVHGDFQHFNVLWLDGRLTGVVDWPHAGVASRGTDVGHCRLNLAVLLGPQAAAGHLTAYERAAGAPVDRRADLRSLLCFDVEWQEFIPRQVAGRAALDVAGMPDRVAHTVRDALDALDASG
nr:phosphotransferase [Nocardioides luti]